MAATFVIVNDPTRKPLGRINVNVWEEEGGVQTLLLAECRTLEPGQNRLVRLVGNQGITIVEQRD